MLLVGSLGKRLWLRELPTTAFTIVGIIFVNKHSQLLTIVFIGFFNTTLVTLFNRETVSDLGQDSYFQVRRRSAQDHCVSSILSTPPHRSYCLNPHSWGQSAGGISITAQLVTSSFVPPFRAAIFVRVRGSKTHFGTTEIFFPL